MAKFVSVDAASADSPAGGLDALRVWLEIQGLETGIPGLLGLFIAAIVAVYLGHGTVRYLRLRIGGVATRGLVTGARHLGDDDWEVTVAFLGDEGRRRTTTVRHWLDDDDVGRNVPILFERDDPDVAISPPSWLKAALVFVFAAGFSCFIAWSALDNDTLPEFEAAVESLLPASPEKGGVAGAASSG